MSGKITLIGKTWANTHPLTIVSRAVSDQDAEGLAKLFFMSYEDGSVNSQAEAREIIQQLFDGEFGALIPDASQVIADENGRLIAAILVLESRRGDGLPQSPSIFELFTAASRRREGMAEQLLRLAIDRLHHGGYEDVALRIDEDNSAALALYLTLDFNRWFPDSDDVF